MMDEDNIVLPAIRLAIVPEGVKRAACLPKRDAILLSNALTVGSSPKTSSPNAEFTIACFIDFVGFVTVSDLKSTIKAMVEK